MNVYGNLICKNGVASVLRCIESVYPTVDGYYVMDGGSTDGTLEILKRYQKAYNLTIFEHPFDRIDLQRNRLLEKTPKNGWILNLNQDEKFNYFAMARMRVYIQSIDRALYDMEPGLCGDCEGVERITRSEPLVMEMPYVTLIRDLKHSTPSNPEKVLDRVFFYDRTLHFNSDDKLVYDGGGTEVKVIPAQYPFSVISYELLDEGKVKSASLAGKKAENYERILL